MKDGWKKVKLGEVAEILLGKTINSKTDRGKDVPYLCAVNIKFDSIDLTTLKTFKLEDNEMERYTVRNGDVLVCEGGDVGRTAIWDEDYNIYYQNALHRIRFNVEEINSRYFLYWMWNKKNKGNLDKIANGVTIKHLSLNSLRNISVPLPPIETQRQIVSELDLLNTILSKKKELLKELDNLAQSTFYEMFGDPVENEKQWSVKKWKEVLTIINGKNQKEVESVEGQYKICGSGGFMNAFATNYLCDENTIIIGRKGNINKPIFMREKFWNVDTAFGLSPMLGVILPEYLFFFCSAYNFEKLNKAVTIPSLTKCDLLEIEMGIPPLPFQQTFADKVSAIERMKEQIKASIADTQQLLDATMDKYFG